MSPVKFKWFALCWLGFSIFWTVFSFSTTYGNYRSVLDDYEAGNYSVVEGVVEDFVPTPFEGNGTEQFRVGGASFSYSDYSLGPKFTNTSSHGGPIWEGVFVRIAYVDANIVRLEMRERDVEAAKIRHRVTLAERLRNRPPIPSPFKYLIGPFLMLAVIGNAAIWRWRGRDYIRSKPELRTGYNRMSLGLAIWGSLPFAVLGLGFATDNIRSIGEALYVASSNSFVIAWFASVVLLDGLLIYWTFWKDGAAKLVSHPGLIEHEWVAKTIPIAGVIVQFLTLAISNFMGIQHL